VIERQFNKILTDHATLTSIRSILLCAIYYYLWAILLPKWRDYSLRQEFVTLDGGAQTLQLRKIPNSELEAWDATHDAAGHVVGYERSDVGSEEKVALDRSGSHDDGKQARVFVNDDVGRV
jgi:hypothetical protein